MLRQERKSRPMTQLELAKKAGISVPTLRLLEQGLGYTWRPPASVKTRKRRFSERTLEKTNTLSESGVSRTDVLRMIKRRAKAAGLSDRICCHTFRATGITAYLEAEGTIENAQAIAAHESPRTTKLYNRTSDELTLDEVERIAI